MHTKIDTMAFRNIEIRDRAVGGALRQEARLEVVEVRVVVVLFMVLAIGSTVGSPVTGRRL